MIRRIILENYMAHIRTVIEPAEGLTVLIGPNNCGKSAVIHALEMICYNSDAADFAIRHGTKKATVTVETEDENGVMHTLVWWRTKTTAGYSVDGREISGLGRNVPDDLHDHLLMPKIEPSAGGEPFLLHFGFQKSPIFLLDDPASRAAHFFASSSDADKLLEMQKRHAQKSSAAKRDKEKLDDRLEDLDKQLEVLTPLPEIARQLHELETDHLKLIAFGEALEGLGDSIDEFARATDREEASAMRLRTLAALQPPPSLHEVFPLVELVRSMSGNQSTAERTQAVSQVLVHLKSPPVLNVTTALSLLCRQMDAIGIQHELERSKTEAIAPLKSPPIPRDTAALRQLTVDIAKAEARQRQSEAFKTALDGLAEAPALHDVAPLAGVLAGIENFTRQSRHHQAAHLVLAEVAQPPALADLIPLRDEIQRIDKALQLESDRRTELQQTEGQLANLRQEITLWVEEHPRCTTCGQAVSAELIFSGGHDHG